MKVPIPLTSELPMRHKTKILMPVPLYDTVINALESEFELIKLWQSEDPDALIAREGANIKALATGVSVLAQGRSIAIDADFMARFPNLQIISHLGVGYDLIDAAWAGAHGIIVTNTPDVLTDETADTALGLLLSTVRQLPQADRYVREGKWPTAPFPLTGTLRHKKIGIAGLGRIGKAIAKRLEPLSVDIVYFGRQRQMDVSYRYYNDLKAMARDCDILIIAIPANPSTHHLVTSDVLDALGPDGMIINIARGSLIDEVALIKALEERRIFSAGLDVFEHEPHVPTALMNMEHIVLFPHIGSASHETRAAMGTLMVDNLRAWHSGKSPLTPVPETPVSNY
jgi:lactate dehydrogenase-like 2-hydroxyacid dehydrogenase